MACHPLSLSAHPSAWTAGANPGRPAAGSSGAAICQFCGQPTAGWQEPYHLNGDHADDADDNVAISCPLCHLTQHLNRPDIDREAVLIWLPEMAQGAVNILARHVHLACAAAGKTPGSGLDARERTKAAPAGLAALFAYEALHERAAVADIRLGTSSPRQLGAALLELPPVPYQHRTALLGGIRLLPLGRLFHDGRDIYPDMLRSWAAVSGQPA